MSAVVLQFVASSDPMSWAIMRISRHYSHVDVVLPDETLLGARQDGGVAIRPANYEKFTKRTRVFVLCGTLTGNEGKDVYAYDWYRAQIGKPYDTRAIEAFVAGFLGPERDWQAPDSWYCSELAIAGLLASGIARDPGVSANHITPWDAFLIAGQHGTVQEMPV